MKKGFLIAATGAISLMLASCSADEPIARNTSDGAINYSVAAANQSRAAHSYCANNMPGSFKVWAKHGTVIYIDGDTIEKRGGEYIDVTGSRFWPVNTATVGAESDYDALSFYAVADGDFSETVTFDYATMSVKDYTIKDNVADQLDLMYATNIDATYDQAQPVQLNFRHALSQICFKAKNEGVTNRITVKAIELCNLNNKGTYTLPAVSTTSNINQHTSTTAADRTHGEWSAKEGNAKYSVTVGNSDGLILDNAAQYLNVSNLEGDHTQTDWSKVFTLLPQKQPAATIVDNAEPAADAVGTYFKLTLKVENVGKDNKYEPVHDGDFYLYLGVNIDWKEGNRYIYTFNFTKDWSPENLKAIEYTVTTDDFIEIDLNPEINGHEAVLMREAAAGVEPLYVATKNVGAASPSDYGLYFWWGDVVGRYYNYTDNFKFSSDNSAILTMGLDLNDATNKAEWLVGDNLKPEKDAAHVKWGGTWRMPTNDDLRWLMANCTWTEVKEGEGANARILGVKVVSKTTGGEILLPAASCFQEDEPGKAFHGNPGMTWFNWYFYWSATVYNDDNGHTRAWRLGGAKAPFGLGCSGLRYDGFPIRAVANSVEVTPANP